MMGPSDGLFIRKFHSFDGQTRAVAVFAELFTVFFERSRVCGMGGRRLWLGIVFREW